MLFRTLAGFVTDAQKKSAMTAGRANFSPNHSPLKSYCDARQGFAFTGRCRFGEVVPLPLVVFSAFHVRRILPFLSARIGSRCGDAIEE